MAIDGRCGRMAPRLPGARGSQQRSRTAIAVIAGIRNVLIIDRPPKLPPKVERVVGLEDFFQPVIQPAIAQNESLPAQFQIAPVIPGNSVGDEGGADLIQWTVPRLASKVGANGGAAVNFCVGEWLVSSVVPSEAPKSSEQLTQCLLNIQAKAVFHSD